MTKEISISLLLKVLKSAWWKILIITVTIAIAAAAFTTFFIPKKYSSSVRFFVINISVENDYTTNALVDAAPKLAKDYIEIIKGDKMLNKVIEELKSENGERQYSDDERLTPAYIRSLISGSTTDGSAFNITVTSTDAEFAYDVAVEIQEHAPEIVKETARPLSDENFYYWEDKDGDNKRDDNEYISITAHPDYQLIDPSLRESKLSATPVSPDVKSNTLIAAVGAAVISYALFFVIKLFDTVIRGEDSAKALVGLPIIGKIPTWEKSTKPVSSTNTAKESQK